MVQFIHAYMRHSTNINETDKSRNPSNDKVVTRANDLDQSQWMHSVSLNIWKSQPKCPHFAADILDNFLERFHKISVGIEQISVLKDLESVDKTKNTLQTK